MKTLYLECNMGAAGDMLTAALLDLLPAEKQREFLRVMNAIPGVEVAFHKAESCGVNGLHLDVSVHGQEEHSHDLPCGASEPPAHGHGDVHAHDHPHSDASVHRHEHPHEAEHIAEHGHTHHHHSLGDIRAVIQGLAVPAPVKEKAMQVYAAIAAAEGAVHGKPVDEVHFHEVGALDAVADVTAACLLLHWLAPDEVVASPVHVGSGQVKCAHGILPVPAPATALLLQGVPSYGGTIRGELCTPTGAALLKTFASRFGPMPLMATQVVGVGVGTKQFEAANILRAFWGESGGEGFDEIIELRCNLDDMPGEDVAYAASLLLEAGALDAYTVPIQMKKSRPAVMLCCLCRPADQARLTSLMLRHTTTWGVRACPMGRAVLSTRAAMVETQYGPVQVKLGEGHGVQKAKVEYASAGAAAREKGVTLKEVRHAALEMLQKPEDL